MEKILQIPCELISSATRSISKTTKLTFESQEAVPSDLIAQLTQCVGQTGWLTFLAEKRQIDTLDIVNLPEITIEKGEKSKATRLRSSLYRLWESEGKQGDFETAYNVQMEKLIDFVKSKIK